MAVGGCICARPCRTVGTSVRARARRPSQAHPPSPVTDRSPITDHRCGVFPGNAHKRDAGPGAACLRGAPRPTCNDALDGQVPTPASCTFPYSTDQPRTVRNPPRALLPPCHPTACRTGLTILRSNTCRELSLTSGRVLDGLCVTLCLFRPAMAWQRRKQSEFRQSRKTTRWEGDISRAESSSSGR